MVKEVVSLLELFVCVDSKRMEKALHLLAIENAELGLHVTMDVKLFNGKDLKAGGYGTLIAWQNDRLHKHLLGRARVRRAQGEFGCEVRARIRVEYKLPEEEPQAPNPS
jgi:hypothetical protein